MACKRGRLRISVYQDTDHWSILLYNSAPRIEELLRIGNQE
jgi:hypothetical protein